MQQFAKATMRQSYQYISVYVDSRGGKPSHFCSPFVAIALCLAVGKPGIENFL